MLKRLNIYFKEMYPIFPRLLLALIVVGVIVEAVAIILNLIFMNNLPFFIILYAYGYLMSKWFFFFF